MSDIQYVFMQEVRGDLRVGAELPNEQVERIVGLGGMVHCSELWITSWDLTVINAYYDMLPVLVVE